VETGSKSSAGTAKEEQDQEHRHEGRPAPGCAYSVDPSRLPGGGEVYHIHVLAFFVRSLFLSCAREAHRLHIKERKDLSLRLPGAGRAVLPESIGR